MRRFFNELFGEPDPTLSPSQSGSPKSVVRPVDVHFSQTDAQRLKHICMVKAVDIYIACVKVQHSQINEAIAFYHKIRCIKVTENIGASLHIITTELNAISDEIAYKLSSGNLSLPDIDKCLALCIQAEGEDIQKLINRFYYPQSEIVPAISQDFLEPIILPQDVDMSSLLSVIKQSLELIEGKVFKYDVEINSFITAWLKLERLANISIKPPSAAALEPEQNKPAIHETCPLFQQLTPSYEERGRQPSSDYSAASNLSKNAAEVENAFADVREHLRNPFSLEELKIRIAQERELLLNNPASDHTQLILLLKSYSMGLLSCLYANAKMHLYGNYEIDNTDLINFYGELDDFKIKSNARTDKLLTELINLLEDLETEAHELAEASGCARISWNLPSFSSFLELYLELNPTVTIDDLSFPALKQIPPYEQLKMRCLEKIQIVCANIEKYNIQRIAGMSENLLLQISNADIVSDESSNILAQDLSVRFAGSAPLRSAGSAPYCAQTNDAVSLYCAKMKALHTALDKNELQMGGLCKLHDDLVAIGTYYEKLLPAEKDEQTQNCLHELLVQACYDYTLDVRSYLGESSADAQNPSLDPLL